MPKIFESLPKWRNFAHSGHTDCEEKRCQGCEASQPNCLGGLPSQIEYVVNNNYYIHLVLNVSNRLPLANVHSHQSKGENLVMDTDKPKSFSKVEWTGVLYSCLHAFIHWRHRGAGLKNFIHHTSWQLWQLYPSRTVHASKNKHARLFYLTRSREHWSGNTLRKVNNARAKPMRSKHH